MRELVAQLAALTDGELVGVYGGGSYALGAYEAGRSDLDVAAVVASPASQSLKESIVAAVRHESLPCPARGLELVVYRRDAVGEATTEATFELNLNTGAEMAFRVDFQPDASESHWFPIDRSILRECGVALYGPLPGAVFAPLARPRLAAVLVQSLRWYATRAARADDAVLNACRAWRWAVDGVWTSKPAAGAWALARPDAPPVIAEALEARREDRHLDASAVRGFLRRVTGALERVTAG